MSLEESDPQRQEVDRGRGLGEWLRGVFSGDRASVGDDEKVLAVLAAQQCECA